MGCLSRVHKLLQSNEYRHSERESQRNSHQRRYYYDVELKVLLLLLRKVVFHRLGQHVHLDHNCEEENG